MHKSIYILHSPEESDRSQSQGGPCRRLLKRRRQAWLLCPTTGALVRLSDVCGTRRHLRSSKFLNFASLLSIEPLVSKDLDTGTLHYVLAWFGIRPLDNLCSGRLLILRGSALLMIPFSFGQQIDFSSTTIRQFCRQVLAGVEPCPFQFRSTHHRD